MSFRLSFSRMTSQLITGLSSRPRSPAPPLVPPLQILTVCKLSVGPLPTGVWTQGFELLAADFWVRTGLNCPVGTGLSCILP